jgi:hypothetical protein
MRKCFLTLLLLMAATSACDRQAEKPTDVRAPAASADERAVKDTDEPIDDSQLDGTGSEADFDRIRLGMSLEHVVRLMNAQPTSTSTLGDATSLMFGNHYVQIRGNRVTMRTRPIDQARAQGLSGGVKDRFADVKKKMTQPQVVELLGRPWSVMGESQSAASFVWADDVASYTVVFAGGKVARAYTGPAPWAGQSP